jgi:hypothetical protein
MSNWENQVRENAAAIQKIITDAQEVLQLPTNTNLAVLDWIVVWSVANSRLEKLSVNSIKFSSPGWIWNVNYWMVKGTGTNVDVLEVDDEVYFRKITNAGDPITLIGFTYNGGDEQLQTSYTQNQALTT